MQINPSIVERASGDELILLNIESGQLYSLNETGAVLWPMIKENSNDALMADALQEKFEVEAAAAISSARDFIADLKAQNILV